MVGRYFYIKNLMFTVITFPLHERWLNDEICSFGNLFFIFFRVLDDVYDCMENVRNRLSMKLNAR